jgi:hypothetical protein
LHSSPIYLDSCHIRRSSLVTSLAEIKTIKPEKIK